MSSLYFVLFIFLIIYKSVVPNDSNIECLERFGIYRETFINILKDFNDCKVYLILDEPNSNSSDSSFITKFETTVLPIIYTPYLLAQTYSGISKVSNLMNYAFGYDKKLFCSVTLLIFQEAGKHKDAYIIPEGTTKHNHRINHPFKEFGLITNLKSATGEFYIPLKSFLFIFSTQNNPHNIADFIYGLFTEIYLGQVIPVDYTKCKFTLKFVCRYCEYRKLVMIKMPRIERILMQQHLSIEFRQGVCLFQPHVNYVRTELISLPKSTELESAYPIMTKYFANSNGFSNYKRTILQHLEYLAFHKEWRTYCNSNYSMFEIVDAKLDPDDMLVYGDISETDKNDNSQNIILRDHTSYNFVTCFEVANSLSFSSYGSPFQIEIWISLATVLTILTLLVCYVEYVQRYRISYIWTMIKLIKPLIEQGQVQSYYKALNKSRLAYLFGVWLLFGMVLTNIYKCIVTSELVCPLRIYSPWDKYEKILNFTMLTHSSGSYFSTTKLRNTSFYRITGFDANAVTDIEIVHGILANTEYSSDASAEHSVDLFTGQSEMYACKSETCLSEFIKLSKSDCTNLKYVYADTQVHLNKFYGDLLIETQFTSMEGGYSKGSKPFWKTFDGWTISTNWNEHKVVRNFRALVESGLTVFWKNWETSQFYKNPYWSTDKSLKINSNVDSIKKSHFKPQRLSSNILSIFVVFGSGMAIATAIFFIENQSHRLFQF